MYLGHRSLVQRVFRVVLPISLQQTHIELGKTIMKTYNPNNPQQIEVKSLVAGAVSIFLAVGIVSLLAFSLGLAQMA